TSADNAILVGIAPDTERAPAVVVRIKHAIVIAVEHTPQAFEIGDRCGSDRIAFDGDLLLSLPQRKGDFLRLIDPSIGTRTAISSKVDRQKPVIRSDPGRRLWDAVTSPVKPGHGHCTAPLTDIA